MSTYLKYKPAWLQLLIFGILTIGISFTVDFIAVLSISRIAGISPMELQKMDLSNPAILSSIKALQVLAAIGQFLLPSLVFAYLSDARPLQYIGFKKPVPWYFYLLAIIIIIAALPMVAWLGELNQHMHFPKGMQESEKLLREVEAKSNQYLSKILSMKSPGDLVIMLFILAVIPAISEELFFRGVLQRLFIQVTQRPWIGIIITAAFFSALHLQFLGFIPRLVLGIVLGALFWFSGSLWPGIMSHFIYNALQIILVYYNPGLVEREPNFAVGLVSGSTILVGALTWWMQKISETSYAEVYDTDDDFHIGPRDQYIA